jgi:hypothetical protein
MAKRRREVQREFPSKRFRALDSTVASRTRSNLKNIKNRFVTEDCTSALELNLERGGLYATPREILHVQDFSLCDPVHVTFAKHFSWEDSPLLVELLSKSNVTRSMSVVIGRNTQVTDALMKVLGANQNITTLTICMVDLIYSYKNVLKACNLMASKDNFLKKLIIRFSSHPDGVYTSQIVNCFCDFLRMRPSVTQLELHDCKMKFVPSLSNLLSLKSLKFYAVDCARIGNQVSKFMRLALQHPTLEELEITIFCGMVDICSVLIEYLPKNKSLERLRVTASNSESWLYTSKDFLKNPIKNALRTNTTMKHIDIVETYEKYRIAARCNYRITANARLLKLNVLQKWNGIKRL